MAVTSGQRLFRVASQFNIGKEAIVEYLASKGFPIEAKPTAVLTEEMLDLVTEKFSKELKSAEKQREKVQRQQQVRKNLIEHGTTVSVDSFGEPHAHEVVSGKAAAVPAQPETTPAPAAVPEVTPPQLQPEVVPPVAVEVAPVQAAEPEPTPVVETHEPKRPAVGTVIDLKAIKELDKKPEILTGKAAREAAKNPPKYATSQPAKPTEAEPVTQSSENIAPAPITAEAQGAPAEVVQPEVQRTEPEAAEGVSEQVVPVAAEAQPAPAKDTVQEQASSEAKNIASTPSAESTPVPPTAQEQPTQVGAEAVSENAEAEAPAEQADAQTEGAGDGSEPKKRKRKGMVEVDYQPGQAPKLRGLTVLGKIDLKPKVEPKPKQKNERPERGGNDRGHGNNRNNDRGDRQNQGGKGTIGDAVAARGKKEGGSTPAQKQPGSTPGTQQQSGGTFLNDGSRGGRKGASPNAQTARKDDKKKGKKGGKSGVKSTFSDLDVDKAIKATLSGMEDSSSTGRSKLRQRKRTEREEREVVEQERIARENMTLRLSEFVTTADLGNLMRVSAGEIIMKCMGLGLMVSINQRLDKETIILIASDYGFEVEFLDEQEEQDIIDEVDPEETLQTRPPIVTIMGHVDHGKTSLLDYIRNANVVAGEAGGITQHIGAYRVQTQNGRFITFLDTPGHEAFTAMRARGAQVTDIVVLVVAADDSVMPQTIEAISHAQAANVPIVVAINKIDRPEANPDRIRQQLADHNVLVEDWGGKYQVAEISAKQGLNIDGLLEKILLEADLQELKANPDRAAKATVIEAHIDKGRGNVVTVIVEKGTLNVGDIFVCGQFAGRVRALSDERGHRVESAGPSFPVQVTGFDGLPNSGDILLEMETDAEARDIANRRQQLRREQQFRGMRHLTLDDISAQIQQGGVKELRLIVKADVSGSVEALSDSLQKLSTAEVKVRILYKSVGAITESDVMLAAASEAIIVAFQSTVPTQARKLAESEQVDIRLYSIIYDCINEVQLALEGMLSPDIKEEITSTIEVRATFKISKLGTIAGCYVQSGKITRNDRIRVMRDGFEIYKGTLASLKRGKDDVREVDTAYECGIGVNGFNDLEVGDIIEGYKTIEVKRKLA